MKWYKLQGSGAPVYVCEVEPGEFEHDQWPCHADKIKAMIDRGDLIEVDPAEVF